MMAMRWVPVLAVQWGDKMVDKKAEMWGLWLVGQLVAVMVGKSALMRAGSTGTHSGKHWEPQMVCYWVAWTVPR